MVHPNGLFAVHPKPRECYWVLVADGPWRGKRAVISVTHVPTGYQMAGPYGCANAKQYAITACNALADAGVDCWRFDASNQPAAGSPDAMALWRRVEDAQRVADSEVRS
jgi:hypothetical protein